MTATLAGELEARPAGRRGALVGRVEAKVDASPRAGNRKRELSPAWFVRGALTGDRRRQPYGLCGYCGHKEYSRLQCASGPYPAERAGAREWPYRLRFPSWVR